MRTAELRERLGEAGPDYRVEVELVDGGSPCEIDDVRVDHHAKLVVLEVVGV